MRVVLAGMDQGILAGVRNDLEDYGYSVHLVDGTDDCEVVVRAAKRAPFADIDAIVLDSHFVGHLSKLHSRNIVREIDEHSGGVPIVVYMTAQLGDFDISNPGLRAAVEDSAAVIHAPANSVDLYLRLESLERYAEKPSLSPVG